MKTAVDYSILKKIVNNNFTWSDVWKEGIEGVNANVYCPFHENTRTPSARIYFNDKQDYYILYCYTERRAFTVFDYVNLVLVEKLQRYNNVEEFLIQQLGDTEFKTLYSEYKELKNENEESDISVKVEYIDNVYNETLNIVDYIEALYTA